MQDTAKRAENEGATAGRTERERHRPAVFRAAFLAPLLVFALVPMGLAHVVLTRSPVPSHRYLMPRWWYRFALKAIGIRVIREGRPTSGRPLLLLSNHVSWTDIVVLGAHVPGCFVAKSDMEHWPAVGFLTKFTRSIFVRRDDPRTVGEQAREIAERLRDGETVILFPEGTTAAGTYLKPFKSSLLGAVRLGLGDSLADMTIQPAALAYVRRGGRPMDEAERRDYAAWIDDEEFSPHLTSVIFGRPMTVRLIFGEPRVTDASENRKDLTRWSENAVGDLLSEGLAKG